MAKLTTFTVGYCTHRSCMAVRGTGMRVCHFPARTYLIEVQGQRWLWDTGYAQHFHTHTARGIFKFYAKITPVHLKEQEALVTQLAQQDIAVGSLTGILLSHFHGDHIAGVRDFPQTPLYCSQPGWEKLKHAKGLNALRQGFVPALLPDDFDSRVAFIEHFSLQQLPSELAPFQQGWLLPESGGEVYLVGLPGHAKGQMGAFVQTEEGWVLLASDAAWAPQNYQELIEPAWPARLIMDDYKQFKQTLQQLHELHQKGQVKILLCHEGGI